MVKKSQYQLIQDIHIKVVKIEEHLKAQNSKIKKNCDDIEFIKPKLMELTFWDKMKTVLLIVFGSIISAMGTYIFLT